ncbi:hypothetical protein [Desulfosoma caldarium]|uniref:Uncharacterized protein n=1 Tax=Desulfosoma caldarium TaxID=610254 RepID=A0A3N1UN37_9BACT|nr:hypothetical protein [Desulfosoma caldarium]ROQ91158.1 hypothetical protein EDC27_2443 [Desulfosoma caldarium]
MRRFLFVLMALGFVVSFGCAKKEPPDVAKAYVNEQIAKHKGFQLDTSKLKYQVVEQTEDSAKVSVTGTIKVKSVLSLVKKGNEWVVAEKAEVHKPKASVPPPAMKQAQAPAATKPSPAAEHKPEPKAEKQH